MVPHNKYSTLFVLRSKSNPGTLLSCSTGKRLSAAGRPGILCDWHVIMVQSGPEASQPFLIRAEKIIRKCSLY